MKVLRGVWERRHLTILVVTHNPDLADQADQRLKLLDGVVKVA
jgi:ABC-type lipoprotein export system ATPase subunit